MNLSEAIDLLDQKVPFPSDGLPDEVFYFISRMTPLVNVDLLIKDKAGRTLLSWRDDQYCGKGWHVPGGIVRFQETLETRLKKVAQMEIGTDLVIDPAAIAFNQLIHPERRDRSHFISILYRCSAPDGFMPGNAGLSPADKGYLKWHERCPDDLIAVHEIYRKYI